MTKETTIYKFEFIGSWARLIERWEHLVLPSDVNIGEMATILPCHYHHPKCKLRGGHQGNLKLDDQRGNNVQV